MPRATWTGSISFGMLSIPVQLFPATSDKDVSFNRLHTVCHGRVKQQNVCPACDGTVLSTTDLERGYEVSKGSYLVIEDDDLAALPVPSMHTVSLTGFVPASEVDRSYTEKTYYLMPEANKGGEKPYLLLLRAMQHKGVFGVGKLTLRTKERLCIIRPTADTLVLETLFWPDEVRLDEVPTLPAVLVTEAEEQMGDALVDMLTDSFKPESYSDEYRESLLDLIARKQSGAVTAPAAAAPATEAPTDLMAALQASMAQLKKSA